MSLQKLIVLQKKEGWTDYEMGLILGLPENTWKQWKSGRRKPKGPAITLITRTLLSLQGKPVNREQLLKKTGRTGTLSAKTLKELNNENVRHEVDR